MNDIRFYGFIEQKVKEKLVMPRKIFFTVPQFIIIVISIILTTTITVLAATGTTDAANAPALTSSYTMEDIYQRLTSGTTGSQSTFTEPIIVPGNGSMHDLNQIMSAAPALDNTNGATADQVLQNQTFWGLTNGQWGLQIGTMSSGSDITGSDGGRIIFIPDGYYSGRIAVANDSDLLAKNIAEGVRIFGVTGTHNGRFVENESSIITDTFTGLMWTKNANLPIRRRTYASASNYCNSLNYAGYTDWQIPSRDQLEYLANGGISVRASTPHNFTNVQSDSYWTSTPVDSTYMYLVSLTDGAIRITAADNYAYTLCMRN